MGNNIYIVPTDELVMFILYILIIIFYLFQFNDLESFRMGLFIYLIIFLKPFFDHEVS